MSHLALAEGYRSIDTLLILEESEREDVVLLERELATALVDRAVLLRLLAIMVVRSRRLDHLHQAPLELRRAVWLRRKSDQYLICNFPGWMDRYIFQRTRTKKWWPCGLCLAPIHAGRQCYKGDRTRADRLRNVRICAPCAERVSPVEPEIGLAGNP